ncbi:MAG: hypothetical protein EOM50_16820, partial [Erysipelotrichia bacterium]|nr:hypothetical protein [Erysipelotrichia bacterium]
LCATISKNSGSDSSRFIFTWLRISWIFLGFGILSGSIWAYRALGWGSYWAWDPIENAALIPWLLLCGYLHYKECNPYQVCIIPFSIACFGVFLARSGILKDQSAHAYTEGNAIITAIILCFILGTILFIIKKIKNTGPSVLNSTGRQIFKLMTGFSALIFIGTLSPLIFGTKTPVSYYTAISLAFAFAYSILLLLQDIEYLKKRSIFMAVTSTIFVVGIMAMTGSDQFGWLVMLWVCLMPFSLWLCTGFPRRWKYYLPHLGVLLLIVGAITSSALSREGFAVAAPDHPQIIISGVNIPLSELSQKDIVMKHLPAEDIIIQCSKITTLPQGGALIPYETRPLIILFWIGGFIVIFAPLSFIRLK